MARSALGILRDGERRAIAFLTLLAPGEVHQTSSVTWHDRYPAIFGVAAKALQQREAPRLLSYGCSTGEEVITLREYFPRARITGAEINPRSLAACRKHRIDERIAFIKSTSRNIAACAPFDAIFCMSVLQRTPHAVESEGVADLSGTYAFERFERQLKDLDAVLATGGILVVHHTQYRFTDTSIASRYHALEGAPDEPPDTPYFDRTSHRVDGPVVLSSMYVKDH